MNKQNMKKLVRERNNMLKKCDVNELRRFVRNNAQIYHEDFVLAIELASDQVLEATLHKMIVNVPSLPRRLREKSAEWLFKRNMDLNV
jgi:hypothetical protein